MKRNNRERLQDILDCAAAISRHVPAERVAFNGDELLQAGLVRWVEIIGEAANNVSKEIRSRYSDVPWVAVIGTRHRIVHSYYEIDLDILWDVVTIEIPKLVSVIRMILQSEPDEAPGV